MKKSFLIPQYVVYITSLMIIAGVPLYMNTSSHDPFYFSKSIFFRCLLAVMIPFAVYLMLFDGEKRRYLNGLTISAAAFWLTWVVASCTPSCWHISKSELVETTTYILAFVLWSYCLPRDRTVTFLKAIAFSALPVAVHSLSQHLGFDIMGMPFWGTTSIIQTRSVSTIGNPIFLAGYLAMILPIVLYLFLSNEPLIRSSKEKKGKHSPAFPARIVYALIWMVCLIALILTYSRGPWLAAAVSHVVLLAAMGKNLLVNYRKYLIIICAFVVLCLCAVFIYERHSKTGFTILDRIKQTMSQSKGTGFAGGRGFLWKSAFMMIRDHPLRGIGPGMFSYAYLDYRKDEPVFRRANNEFMMAPHNEFLGIAVSNGIPGLLSFLSLIACMCYYVITLIRRSTGDERVLWTCVLSACVACIVHLFFAFRTPSTEVLWWFLLAMITRCSASSLMEEKGKKGRSQKDSPGISHTRDTYVRSALFILSTVLACILAFTTFRAAMASYYIDLGKTYESQSKGPEALTFYNKAISFEPKEHLYYLIKGSMLEKWFTAEPSNYAVGEEALTTYKQALRLFAGDPYTWANVGRVCGVWANSSGDFGKFDEAAGAYNRAIEIDRYNYKFYDELGNLYATRKMFNEAEKCFTEGLEVYPDSPQLNYNLAVIFYEKGDYVKSKSLITRALELNPSYEMAKKLKDIIDSSDRHEK
ncbi:MAG: O-antigen ligase family protein [Vulcanimicrobiota bacterium]